MSHFLTVFADIAVPPPPPPPPGGGLPPLVMIAFGVGATAAVSLLVFLWRRTPASPRTTPAGR